MMLYVTDEMDHTLPDPMPSSVDISAPSDGSNPSTSPTLYVHHVYANGSELCSVCNMLILDRFTLYIDGSPYHSQCLRCAICFMELGVIDYEIQASNDHKCFTKDGIMMCKTCYNIKYRKACGRCHLFLMPEDIVMRAKDSIFHMQCFTCSLCGVPMRPGEVFTMNASNEIFCNNHNGVPHPTYPSMQPSTPAPASIPEATPVPKREMSEENEDDGSTSSSSRSKRMRTSFKHHQLKTMKVYFNLNHNPDAKDLKQLAQKTGLTKRVLQVWFQNARAKYRRSMQSRDVQNHSPSMLPSLTPTLGNSSENHSATCSTHSSEMSTSPEYGCPPPS